MGKGEIAHYEQFLLFPQCFQKACFPGASKGVFVWEWVKCDQTISIVFDWVKNILGKGGNAGLPSPTMFSKCSFFRIVKTWDCVVNCQQNSVLNCFQHAMLKQQLTYSCISCISRPSGVADWRACRTYDLVVGSSIPGWGELVSGIFSPITSAEACEKSIRWLWKEKLCLYWCAKARKHMCMADHYDTTLAVKVALNSNITN